MSHQVEIEIMARAIESVPGFDCIIWNAANSLHDAWFENKEVKQYRETHKTTRGARYQRISACAERAAERYGTFVSAACVVMETMVSQAGYCPDHYSIHGLLVDEVREIATSHSWNECNRKAMNY